VQAAAHWQPITPRVQQVQYAPTYGSSGGTGGYPIVLMNNGGYGGAYGSGYASADSSAAYGSYYLSRAYDQRGTYYQPGNYHESPMSCPPAMYFQPHYYGGYYLNPRPVVCGPGGCFER
jgi:hypothetical protein